MRFLACLLICCLALTAGAQIDTVPGVATAIVSTRHTITAAGRSLRYTARAGVLPIRHNDDGSVRAWIFFVAYIADRAPNDPPRPITFAWNGGPGANSLLLHLNAFGPRRLDEGDGVRTASRSARIVDNQETLLTQTDLVFIDPVGTGFSRPAAAAYGSEFYGVREDIAATREFIRVYRTRFDAWDAPVYLLGESYGTWRAAGTAAAMEQAGEHVAGVILISGGIPVGRIASPEMRAGLFLPERIATAAYHHRLADLERDTAGAAREAEQWARTTYVPALTRRGALSPDERQAIIAGLARYTGLDTSVIDKKTLIVDGRTFRKELLRGEGVLGMFDTRQLVRRDTSAADRAAEARRRRLIDDYLRHELGFETDLAYLGLESGWSASGKTRDPNAEWQWDQGEPGAPLESVDDGPPGGTPPWIQRTFAADHATRTFVAAGIYDSLNSCPLITYQISQLEPALRERITFGCYAGGHMMYQDRAARVRLRRDLEHFFDEAAHR